MSLERRETMVGTKDRSVFLTKAKNAFLDRCSTFASRVRTRGKDKVTTKHTIEHVLADALSSKDKKRIAKDLLANYMERLRLKMMTMIGFPINTKVEVRDVADFVLYHMNNVGDAFESTILGVNSHPFEVIENAVSYHCEIRIVFDCQAGVVHWFAKLYEIAPEDAWGYVTAGGTEGNYEGLYTARELLPGDIVYASSEVHYSVPKGCRIMCMPTETIDTLENGEMDYDDLKRALMKNFGKPAIIIATVGSVFYGAIDNVDRIAQALSDSNYTEKDFYIHVDAAFGGLMVPFLQEPSEDRIISFKKPIHSVSVSGYKTLGLPGPCGIVIIRKTKLASTTKDISDLLKSKDTTFLSSRSGQNPIYLWYVLSTKGTSGLIKAGKECQETAIELRNKLVDAGIEATLNANAVTVVFPRPPEKIVQKWQLACTRDKAHVVVREHCTPDITRNFLTDMLQSFTD